MLGLGLVAVGILFTKRQTVIHRCDGSVSSGALWVLGCCRRRRRRLYLAWTALPPIAFLPPYKNSNLFAMAEKRELQHLKSDGFS